MVALGFVNVDPVDVAVAGVALLVRVAPEVLLALVAPVASESVPIFGLTLPAAGALPGSGYNRGQYVSMWALQYVSM